jgi:hypothetical protein
MMIKQNSFTGGELSPRTYARSDLERYGTALRICENFIPRQQGALQNRPGLQYCGPPMVMGEMSWCGGYRIAAFTMTDGYTYVLTFGPAGIRVFYDGSPLLYSTDIYDDDTPPNLIHSEGDPVTVGIELLAAALCQSDEETAWSFAQCGDEISIVSYLPRIAGEDDAHCLAAKLIYEGPDYWTLIAQPFESSEDAVADLAFVGTPDEDGNDDHPPKTWSWYVTAIMDETGEETPVSAELKTSSGLIALYPDMAEVLMDWTAKDGASLYLVYRSRFGKSGLVGSTLETSFCDDGSIAPDYTCPIPRSSYWNEDTTSVCFFQQRQVYGCLPQTVRFSEVADFRFWDIVGRTYDTAPIEHRLASQYADVINRLIPIGRGLIALTETAEHSLQGGENGITPTKCEILTHSRHGSAARPPPAVVDNYLVWALPNGRIRDLAYDSTSESYGGQELSLFADHLFEGLTVYDMAWQADEHVLWVILSDYSLLSLTYLRDQQIWGWARHETCSGDDQFRAVCVAREDGRDVPYFIVRRDVDGNATYYLERLTPRNGVELCDLVLLDCAVSWDGRNTNPYRTMEIGASGEGQAYTVGSQQTLTSGISGMFEDADIGDQIVIGLGTDTEVWLEIVSVTVGGGSCTVEVQDIDVPMSRRGESTADWAWARKTFVVPDGDIWGAEKTLAAVADGAPVPAASMEVGGVSVRTANIVPNEAPYTIQVTADEGYGQAWTVGDKQAITASAAIWYDADVGKYIGLGVGTEDEVWFEIVEVLYGWTGLIVEVQSIDVPEVWRGATPTATWSKAEALGSLTVEEGHTWGAGDEQTLTMSKSLFETADVGSYVCFGRGGVNEITFVITAIAEGGESATVVAQDIAVPEVWRAADPSPHWYWVQPTREITLEEHAVVVHAGIPYESEAELLEVSDATGDARTRQKLVTRVLVEVQETAGLQAGASRDASDPELHDLIRREVADGYTRATPLESGLYEVRCKGTWDNGGRAILRQTEPLPVTILSAIREVQLGGK